MPISSTQDPDESVASGETIQSNLHDHLREPKSSEPTHKGKNRLYYCQYCPWSGQSTTNARLHLRKHDILLEAPVRTPSQSLQSLYNKASEIDQTSELDTRVMRKILNEKTLNEALVSMIVTQNLPFRFIESPFFRAFCRELNPEAQSLISSHSTLRLRISNSWSLHKDILRKKLQSSLSTIHLALDVWTSPNQKLFLGVCAQFVDFETEQLVKALIALPSIPSHHSEVQHNILFKTLQDFGICHKVGAFIGDNATSNDKLCSLLDSKFEEEGIHWKASENRIRCTGHIINLAVQSFRRIPIGTTSSN